MSIRLVAPTVALLAVLALVPVAAQATTPKPVLITITAKKGRPVGGVARPTVKKGKMVKIVVRTDAGRQVHLHGYDIEKTVVAGKPVVFLFRAKIAGRFDLELHHPDILLAELTVK
jgi:hypothetical protein